MDRPVRNFAYRAFISSREPRRVRRRFAGCLQASQRTKPHGVAAEEGTRETEDWRTNTPSGTTARAVHTNPALESRLREFGFQLLKTGEEHKTMKGRQEDRGGRDVGSHARIAEISDGGTEIENLRKTRW